MTVAERDGIPEATRLVAACCGRHTHAGMVRDGSAVPAETRPRGAHDICDACWEHLVRLGLIPPEGAKGGL